jgi:hypothetical protein
MMTVLGGRVRARPDTRGRRPGAGVEIGRLPKPTPHQQREAIKRRDRGAWNRSPRTYNVSAATISRLVA